MSNLSSMSLDFIWFYSGTDLWLPGPQTLRGALEEAGSLGILVFPPNPPSTECHAIADLQLLGLSLSLPRGAEGRQVRSQQDSIAGSVGRWGHSARRGGAFH